MINCDCSIIVDSSPEIFESKIVIARKKYTCVECHSEIEIGQRYEYSNGLWGGQWDSFKTCIPCASIRRDFCPGGSEFGNLCNEIYDCLGFNYLEEK